MCEMKLLLAMCCLAAVVYHQEVAGSCLTERIEGRAEPVSKEELTKAILSYTINQYKHMVQDRNYNDDNLFTSPYSLWSVLTQTYLGSRGTTSEDLAKVLGLTGLDKSQVDKQYQALRTALQGDSSVFTTANLIGFDQQRVRLKNCVADDRQLELGILDFKSRTQESAKTINEWVQGITKGRIDSIITPDVLTPETLMVLLNAVYFKGSWKYQFNDRDTYKDFFIVSPQEVREVDMMKMETLLRSYKLKNLQARAVELPYSGDKYSMIMILPDDRDVNINELIKALTPEDIQAVNDGLREKFTTLYIPKIKIEAKYNMNELLSDMGASSIFLGADLGGFVQTSPPMKVSDVLHQSFIEINEEGTVAAAASGVVTTTRLKNSHVVMKFNRPHVFMIKDNENDVILFMGVIRKPQGTAYTAS